MRIRGGPNRGKRWSVVALGRGYGSGSFGRDRLAVLAAVTRPGDVFWDIGAHKGFVTLAAASMVGPAGRVVAVEPSATNLRFLRRHLAWNGVRNVSVLPLALSDAVGEAAFGGPGSSIAFRLGEGHEKVDVTTVERLVSHGDLPRPHVLKIDVEGAEAAVLRGMGPLLQGDQALLISTHGRQLYEQCRRILLQRGFRVYDSWQIAHRIETGAPWTSDHDLLAVGSRRTIPGELDELALLSGPS
ncbi:MAG TPA: FkbM family methyltransferase [Longimicrobiales bacterium]|nr:FkbM family methyltransferase [Longimicrobiales bacterium]